MSIFLGNLQKYWKGQSPINLLTYTGKFYDSLFPKEQMIFSADEKKNKKFLEEREYTGTKESYFQKIYFERITERLEIFNKEINCTKFVQGIIGDCYILDVISNLSNYGHLLTHIFRIDKSNKQGYYEVC